MAVKVSSKYKTILETKGLKVLSEATSYSAWHYSYFIEKVLVNIAIS